MLTPKISAQLYQTDSSDTSPVRGMDKRHHRAYACTRNRWDQCRSVHSRSDIREKYRGRAQRSTSLGRLLLKAPYFSKRQASQEVDADQNNFVIKSATIGQGAQKENYKLFI